MPGLTLSFIPHQPPPRCRALPFSGPLLCCFGIPAPCISQRAPSPLWRAKTHPHITLPSTAGLSHPEDNSSGEDSVGSAPEHPSLGRPPGSQTSPVSLSPGAAPLAAARRRRAARANPSAPHAAPSLRAATPALPSPSAPGAAPARPPTAPGPCPRRCPPPRPRAPVPAARSSCSSAQRRARCHVLPGGTVPQEDTGRLRARPGTLTGCARTPRCPPASCSGHLRLRPPVPPAPARSERDHPGCGSSRPARRFEGHWDVAATLHPCRVPALSRSCAVPPPPAQSPQRGVPGDAPGCPVCPPAVPAPIAVSTAGVTPVSGCPWKFPGPGARCQLPPPPGPGSCSQSRSAQGC